MCLLLQFFALGFLALAFDFLKANLVKVLSELSNKQGVLVNELHFEMNVKCTRRGGSSTSAR